MTELEGEHLRKVSAKAFSVLRSNQNYPAAQLEALDGSAEIKASIGATLPKPEIPSKERLSYAIKIYDAWARAYLAMVSNIVEQEAYYFVLRGLEAVTK